MTYLARDARGDIIALPGASPAAVASLEPAGDIANTPLSCPDTKCRQPLRLRKTKTDMRFEHDDRRNGCASDIGEKGDWHRWLLTEMLGRAYMQDPGRLSSVADVVVNGLAIQIAHEEIDTSPAYRIQRRARANRARGTVWLVRGEDALREVPGGWDTPGQPEHGPVLTGGYPGLRLSEWVGEIAVQATLEPDYLVMVGVVSGNHVRFVEKVATSRDSRGRTLAAVTQWSEPMGVEGLADLATDKKRAGIHLAPPVARLAYRNRRVRIGLYTAAPELCAEGVDLGLEYHSGEWVSPRGEVFPGGRLIGDLTPEVRAWLERGLGEQRPTSQQTGVLRKLIRDHWQKTPDGQAGYERLSMAALRYVNREDLELGPGEGLAMVIPYLSRREVGKIIERSGWLMDYHARLHALAG